MSQYQRDILLPNLSVSGLLKIDDDGAIKLELDGRLSSDPMSVLLRAEDAKLTGKHIAGILKVSNKHVLLDDLWKQGGRFSTSGMSYEGYAAIYCLIGDYPIPKYRRRSFLGTELEIELNGLEEWLRVGSIKTVRGKSKITATHRRVKDIKYPQRNGMLYVKYHIYGPMLGTHTDRAIELKETVSLSYRSNTLLSFEDMRTEFGLLQELVVLLTNSEFTLNWPSIKMRSGRKDRDYNFYFRRTNTSDEAPRGHECPTNFVQLQETFGEIVSLWKSKREQFGPGFYLYLGLRRGFKLYVEHRFVNLIWGIEALHRKKQAVATPAELHVKEKVQRILDRIDLPKDKKWLANKLKNAHEPTLEQRICDVITTVPIGLDDNNIRIFSERCAKLRNDISHFGAERHGGSYKQFLDELRSKSEALSVVYHMLILHEIGIEEKTIKSWIYNGFKSYANKRYLVEAGLLDASALKPAPPPAAAGR